MDLMSILGWVLSIVVILFGIMFDSGTGEFIGNNLKSFIDIPKMCIRDRWMPWAAPSMADQPLQKKKRCGIPSMDSLPTQWSARLSLR